MDIPASAAAAGAAGSRLFQLLLVCLVVGLVLALVVRWLARRRRDDAAAEAAGGAAAAPASAPAPAELDEVDRLAAAGRHGEAVHALLLLAIARLSRRLPRPPAASRTSRELARQLPLDAGARDAFAALVALVERTLFGGVAAGAAEFQAGREWYVAAVGGRGESGGRMTYRMPETSRGAAASAEAG